MVKKYRFLFFPQEITLHSVNHLIPVPRIILYKNIEYIIIDGGSADDTVKIINQHKDKLPKQLKIVSEKDNAIYDAMNKGVRLATGQLIGIVNSDDWYENDTVEQIVKNYAKLMLPKTAFP